MNISTRILYTALFLLCLLTNSSLNAQIEFVENKGQWNGNVQYRGNFNAGAFFIEKNGFTVMMHKPEGQAQLAEIMHGGYKKNESGTANLRPVQPNLPFKLQSFAYKVKFLGANKNAIASADKSAGSFNNYFIGNDRSKWASDCGVFQEITYSNVYPNIDVRYYTNDGKLKYDFIVRPGGNVNAIAMQYDGPTSLTVRNKELIIGTSIGEVKELYPYTYQNTKTNRQEIESKYVVKDNIVTFNVKNYDLTQTLIIDPSIVFSTFTGSSADNWGYTATPGPDGSFFAGGVVFASGYPVSPGAFDVTFNGGVSEGELGGYDIAIFKFSANGSRRLYATYLGGSGNEQPHSMISDAQGNLIIAGRTNSPITNNSNGYPLTRPVVGSGGGFDIIITKLNAAGNALIGSARIGGSGNDGVNIKPKYIDNDGAVSLRRNYGDDARSEVILDQNNNVFLASSTRSKDFPVINSTIQTTPGNNLVGEAQEIQDGVILKMNPNLSTVLFSTYFGGEKNDACFVASLHPITGDLYIAGSTSSDNLPGDKTGVISAINNGGIDGFVTQLKSDGSALIKTTFVGTSGLDMIYGLKFDRTGYPYIMGTTTGNWPVINAAYSDNGSKQFISKLQPDLSAMAYSTIFGTNAAFPNISPIAFLVDRCENVYVSGWGGGINVDKGYTIGTTAGLPQTNPLPGIPIADGMDFYFFVLEKNAQSRLFASHFGQSGGLGDHVDGGTSRFDENGIIYQAMCANCGRDVVFPTTAGVWAGRNGSTSCNQAALKIEMNFAGVGVNIKSAINGVVNDTSGCLPLKVDFRDSLMKAKTYIWDFGDGSPRQTTVSPNNSISHTYTTVGTFRVMLIGEDVNTCNVRDTAYMNIKVGNNKVNLNFTNVKLPPCENLTMQFTNTSTPVYPQLGPKSFVWDYGDGSPFDTAGINPPRVHRYAQPGTYQVKLKLIDDTFCNAPDSIVKTIRIDAFVKAIFTTDANGCVPYNAVFKNNSQAGTGFQWQFEDGTIFSTAEEPTHLFTLPGTYKVRLIASDPNTCNLKDTSAYFTINVYPIPIAQATWSPNPPEENVPVQFRNLSSQGAVRYLWDFGDGETSTLFEPKHEYNATGTYGVTLIAYNQLGCPDTFKFNVRVIVLPLLDVPNAFTPGKFGVNAVVNVRGFGIQRMTWRIYNRWGQLLFESVSKKDGWDGTFKGKLQPMDVYTYTLDAELTSGEKIRKSGDITLLR